MTTTFPLPAKNNPGVATVFTLHHDENGVQSSEEVHLITLLGEVLTEEGMAYTLDYGWLKLDDGLSLLPQIASLDLEERVRTCTTIELAAGEGAFSGLFEFQHSLSDDSVQDALLEGFRQWVKVDLLVLRDALRETPQDCTILQMELPAEEDHPALTRRILLGPVAHFALHPVSEDEEHPFCPCCLFTNTVESFLDLVKDGQVHMVRFYAARDSDGQSMADCRVNGEDFPAGHAALLSYIDSWPDRGFEFRKQLVLIQNAPTELEDQAEHQ